MDDLRAEGTLAVQTRRVCLGARPKELARVARRRTGGLFQPISHSACYKRRNGSTWSDMVRSGKMVVARKGERLKAKWEPHLPRGVCRESRIGLRTILVPRHCKVPENDSSSSNDATHAS